MKSEYIQYLKGLNISEIDNVLSQLESNLISFDEFQSEVLKYGAYTLITFEKEQKIQELLNENK